MEELLRQIRELIDSNKEMRSALADQIHQLSNLGNSTNEAYRQGLEDMWEISKEIYLMEAVQRGKVFGSGTGSETIASFFDVLHMPVHAVMQNLKEYEAKSDLPEVGDEIEIEDGTKIIVLDVLDDCLYGYDSNGCVEKVIVPLPPKAHKTGKRIALNEAFDWKDNEAIHEED